MAESLRDQLSAAFDENAGETPAVAEEKPQPQEVEKEQPEEKSVARSEAAKARARAEDGKFAKGEKPEPEAQPAPSAAKPRPTSWKKDFEEHWGKLDPALQEYIHQRESEYAKGVSTYKQEWDRAKPILDVIAPYSQQFQKYGVRPEQWIQSLGAAHQALALGSPQEKLQMFARLARDYGIPLQALTQGATPGQPAPQQMMDPRLGMFAQELSSIKNQLQTWRSEQERAMQDGIASEIESFSRDGKHPHFEQLKETMADLLEKGLAKNLEEAHSLALRMPQHDDIWTAMKESERKEKEIAAAKDAQARAAAARGRNVIPKSSAPGNASDPKERKGLRDTIAEAMEASAGRV